MGDAVRRKLAEELAQARAERDKILKAWLKERKARQALSTQVSNPRLKGFLIGFLTGVTVIELIWVFSQ